MTLMELRQRIESREAILGVIGLGYVGLPVACVLARAGFGVIGVELKPERVATINDGLSPVEGDEPGLEGLLEDVVGNRKLRATGSYTDLAQADVVLIDVETPVDDNHRPQYVALSASCRSLGPVLKRGALVIVESTISPGTMDRVVRPLLEDTSGKRVDEDFFLGTCPERVMPGKLLTNLRMMSRVCGGSTPETAETMIVLYRHIVEAELDAADCVTAELVKTAENAYRDVNIAFANELALVCESAGAEFLRVRELVNKSPGRHVLMAGAGVGGHCIPKDSWLLAHSANDQVPLRLIPAARAVNELMPSHVADLTVQALNSVGLQAAGALIAVLGYAYLEDSDDTRNSPSETLVELLRGQGAQVVIHDPCVLEYRGDLLERLRGCDAMVVMVAHRAYRMADLDALRRALRTPVLIDGRRVFDEGHARAAGLIYRGVGLGTDAT